MISYVFKIHAVSGVNPIFVVSECLCGGFLNGGYPKSSILIGFSIINHPFWVPISGNTHVSVFKFRTQPVGIPCLVRGVRRLHKIRAGLCDVFRRLLLSRGLDVHQMLSYQVWSKPNGLHKWGVPEIGVPPNGWFKSENPISMILNVWFGGTPIYGNHHLKQTQIASMMSHQKRTKVCNFHV